MPAAATPATLVVIDADDAMRALVHEWTAGAGYRVRERARPGMHGESNVNLVVVDLCDLPARGALTVERVRGLFPGAAVVGLSTQAARPLGGAALRAIAPGLAALLPKPCTRAELLAVIAAALPRPLPGSAAA